MPAAGDLVHQTSITPGTGAQTLVAVNGKRSFVSAFGTGGTNTFDYYISHRTTAEHERGTGHESGGTLVRDTVLANHLGTTALVNFSAGVKDIHNDMPAAKQVHTDLAQTLDLKNLTNSTATTPAFDDDDTSIATTAHAKLYAAPWSAMAERNIIMNNCGRINQESGDGYFGANWINFNGYFMDQWKINNSVATPGSISFGIGVTAMPGSPAGFSSSMVFQVLTAAYTSVGTNDFVYLIQPIEFSRMKHLGFGRAAANPVTLGFWIYSSAAGTMCVALSGNGTGPRVCVQEITINAGTPEYKTVTFPADTTSPASWEVAENVQGAALTFTMAAGASKNDATAGAWATLADDYATANQSNFFGTVNNVVCITGVTLLPGNKAPSQAVSPLLQKPYGQELLDLQRYYWRHNLPSIGPFVIGVAQGTTTVVGVVRFPVLMRAQPSVAATGSWGFNISGTPLAMSALSSNFASQFAAQMAATLTPAADYVGEAGRIEAQNTTAAYLADARMY